jgi:S1-C subfamily serine protease
VISNNVWTRVFQLRVGQGTGTIFLMEKDDRQYWVTAKHVLEGWVDGQRLEIRQLDGWKGIPLSLVGHHPTADVSVLTCAFHVEVHPVPATLQNLGLPQEVFFLGFPFGWAAEMPANLNRDCPMPFFKRGFISAICPPSPGLDNVQFVDGHNNPGFSGGPLVFNDHFTGEQKICGVVSGYRIQPEDVYVGQDRIDAYVRANSGLMICEEIKRVDEIIDQNPVGILVPQR